MCLRLCLRRVPAGTQGQPDRASQRAAHAVTDKRSEKHFSVEGREGRLERSYAWIFNVIASTDSTRQPMLIFRKRITRATAHNAL